MASARLRFAYTTAGTRTTSLSERAPHLWLVLTDIKDFVDFYVVVCPPNDQSLGINSMRLSSLITAFILMAKFDAREIHFFFPSTAQSEHVLNNG